MSAPHHPNDTLNGALLMHAPPEEHHLRHKLGYWREVEKRVIRDQLVTEGHDPNALGFFQKVAERICANHANDETYRETSARLSTKWALGRKPRAAFDQAELEFPVLWRKRHRGNPFPVKRLHPVPARFD